MLTFGEDEQKLPSTAKSGAWWASLRRPKKSDICGQLQLCLRVILFAASPDWDIREEKDHQGNGSKLWKRNDASKKESTSRANRLKCRAKRDRALESIDRFDKCDDITRRRQMGKHCLLSLGQGDKAKLRASSMWSCLLTKNADEKIQIR